jgi:hypothetical protein
MIRRCGLPSSHSVLTQLHMTHVWITKLLLWNDSVAYYDRCARIAKLLLSVYFFCTLLFKSPNNNDFIKDSGLEVQMVEPCIGEVYLARQRKTISIDRASDAGFISKMYASLAWREGAISSKSNNLFKQHEGSRANHIGVSIWLPTIYISAGLKILPHPWSLFAVFLCRGRSSLHHCTSTATLLTRHVVVTIFVTLSRVIYQRLQIRTVAVMCTIESVLPCVF